MTNICAACWHEARAARIRKIANDPLAATALAGAERAANEEPHTESAPNCRIGIAIAQEHGIPDWPTWNGTRRMAGWTPEALRKTLGRAHGPSELHGVS